MPVQPDLWVTASQVVDQNTVYCYLALTAATAQDRRREDLSFGRITMVSEIQDRAPAAEFVQSARISSITLFMPGGR